MPRTLLVLMSCLLLVTSCAKKQGQTKAPAPGKAAAVSEAAEFYDALNALQRRHEAAYAELLRGFDPSAVQNLDHNSLKANQEKFVQSVSKARADLKVISVPEVKGAAELYAANERFFQAEETTMKAGAQITEALTRAALGTVDFAELGDTLARVKTEREKIKNDLKKAQDSFRKTHKVNVGE